MKSQYKSTKLVQNVKTWSVRKVYTFRWQRSSFNSPLANTKKKKRTPNFRIINLLFKQYGGKFNNRSRQTGWKNVNYCGTRTFTLSQTLILEPFAEYIRTRGWKLFDKWDIEIMLNWQWIRFKFKCVFHVFPAAIFCRKFASIFYCTFSLHRCHRYKAYPYAPTSVWIPKCKHTFTGTPTATINGIKEHLVPHNGTDVWGNMGLMVNTLHNGEYKK